MHATKGINHTNGGDECESQMERGEMSNWAKDPIAIVGMGMRLPGKIHSGEEFWKFLESKGNGRLRVPSNRYNVEAFFDNGKSGTTCTEYGYFLDDVDLASMDTTFWSVARKEAELLDPQQRLMLEVVYECLENSGTTNYRGQNIGCYVGVFGEDWVDMQSKDTLNSGQYRITGYGDFALSNRVSYEFGFKGPSLTIRTACSSSMTALYEACQALYAGECSSAVVGGANLILSPHMTVAMTEQGVLSPSGMCKPFDASADGYARGEAVNAIYIKRLSEAIRHRDPIRAIIRSACINSDGKTLGLSVPNPDSHEILMRRSHELAGINDLSKTAMIECHGTGTKVGDPLEAKAVARVFGQWGIIIGSVKSNLGHSEGASGLTSIIKMTLALEKKKIPPNINFHVPNPEIPFESARIRVPVECEDWPQDKAERVGVNSFGIGGSNAHVLLESAESFLQLRKAPSISDDTTPSLLLFSSTHPESLRRKIDNIRNYAQHHPKLSKGISYTLAFRRESFRHRAFAIVSPDGKFDASVSQRAKQDPRVVYVFTGQAAQYAGMGRDLLLQNAVFAASIDRLDVVLKTIDPLGSWTLREEILRSEETSRLSQAMFSQPCCTAIQIALVDLLKTMNVRPTAVVGHSSGEIAAAYASGVLSATDTFIIAYHRGQLSAVTEKRGNGGMLAVGLGADKVYRFLSKNVSIGCENSTENVTLTGQSEALNTVAKLIEQEYPDTLIRRLRVNCAYHSSQMTEIADEYLSKLNASSISPQALTCEFFSSVTGERVCSGCDLGPSYWCRNLVSPVLFKGAISCLLGQRDFGDAIFVEVGPHNALSGPLRQISQRSFQDLPLVPTLVRNMPAGEAILRCAGYLFQFGVAVNLSTVIHEQEVLYDIPPYSWQREGHYWSESRISRDWRMRNFSRHEALGIRITDGNDLEPTWRNVIRLDDISWLRDHNILGQVVFPASGYISIMGEAIRQLTKASAFSCRDIHFHKAMVLKEDTDTEVVTQLRPVRLTNTVDSSIWWDLSIVSVCEGIWTKNCTGQIRGGEESHYLSEVWNFDPGKRAVEPLEWYKTLERLGLRYGPTFQGLRSITASLNDSKATAEIDKAPNDCEGLYPVHPCMIDAIFQLCSVAACNGLTRLFNHFSIPTSIGELQINPLSSGITAEARASTTSTGGVLGDAIARCGDETVLQLKNITMTKMSSDEGTRNDDPHAAGRLVWKPAIEFVDIGSYIRPLQDDAADKFILDELVITCIVETCHLLDAKSCFHVHLDKYRDWLQTQVFKAKNGQYEHVDNCAHIFSIGSSERVQHIQRLVGKTVNTVYEKGATAVYRVFENVEAIFAGDTEPLELLLMDDLLGSLYHFRELCDYTPWLELLGHAQPHMKILEIGAGTGGTTATVLSALQTAGGERLYGHYTFTDISAAFFASAKDTFKDYEAMEFKVLDINIDPQLQGFEHNSYDMIIASNVLHATPSLSKSLTNVKKLLKPSGYLFLQELSPVTKWINYVMGVLPGWWLGERDNRPSEPYVNVTRWDVELKKSGFNGAEIAVHDGHMNIHIISKIPPPPNHNARRITMLRHQHLHDSAADDLQEYLRINGFELDSRYLGEKVPPKQTIVSVLELESPFTHCFDSPKFDDFKSFLRNLEGCPVLWITRSSQAGCVDPRFATSLGLARTIRTEFGIDFSSLELDVINKESFDACLQVIQMMETRVADEKFDPASEFVFTSGTVLTGRFYPYRLGSELLETETTLSHKELRIAKHGFLQSLYWGSRNGDAEITGNLVEVDVHAVGLNFRDVLIAMGVVEESDLGVECSGIVKRVGPSVISLCPGDRVAVLTGRTFATTIITSESLCVRIPPGLGFIDAAAMPCVFVTVIQSLIEVARISEGDSVLIHSACGGVGLAAIQICRMVGADIFCTVGSNHKVDYLHEKVGIPRNRIFNSRNRSFAHDIKVATNGRGVDVVLNSLSGELLHASWECVAENGTMIEIGKRDLRGKAKLSMEAFEGNRIFAGVDITRICAGKPEKVQRLLHLCMQYLEQGYVSPLPVEEFQASSIEKAFRYMQKGTHIGKIVISLKPSEAIRAVTSPKSVRFRSDGCHIIVGGLGGLGRSLSVWMAMHGASHLILFSRKSGKNGQNDKIVPELRALGCRVDLYSGDVSNEENVDTLIRDLTEPVAGVVQASMVLKDVNLANMTFDDWQSTILPKVTGTWNLHNALQKYKQNPDYFILFSSSSGLFGQHGQANYASANSFLDAFAQYRNSLGLPCTTIDIGPVENVGYVGRNAPILDHFRATATYTLLEQDLLDSIQLALENSQSFSENSSIKKSLREEKVVGFTSNSQIIIGLRSTMPLNLSNNRVIWRRDPRMAIYHNMNTNSQVYASFAGEEVDLALEQFLQEARADPTMLQQPGAVKILAQIVGKMLLSFLLRDVSDVDCDVSLTALGVDSLVAIELRNWFKVHMGLDVTVLELMGGASLMQLGQILVKKLLVQMGSGLA